VGEIDEPEAIRTSERDVVSSRKFREFLLLTSAVIISFGVTGGEDNDPAHSSVASGLERVEYARFWNREDQDVDPVGETIY
jgi:hypothetical protein